MLKRLFKETVIYGISGGALQLVGILLVPIYTRVFSPEEFGAVDLTTTIISFLTVFLLMGLDQGFGRFYSDANDEQEQKIIASTAFIYFIWFTVSTALVAIIFSEFLAKVVYGDVAFQSIVILVLVSMPFTILFNHFKNVLRWRRLPTTLLVLGLSSLLFRTLLTIYFVVWLKKGIIGIFTAQLIGSLLFCLVGYWVTRTNYSVVFSVKHLRAMFSYGLPLVPYGLAYYILHYADRYFLQHYLGLTAVGIYGLGYKITSGLGLLFMGLQSAFGPFVYSSYRDKDAPIRFARLFNYVSVFICIAVLGVSLFSRELILVFGTSDYLEAYKVVPYLAASSVAYWLGGYFSFGIGISKKTIHQAWMSLLAVAVNIGLNFAFIPTFGIVGAALATFVSYALFGLAQIIASQRFYFVPYQFGRNLIMYIIVTGLIIVGYNFFPQSISIYNVVLKLIFIFIGFSVPFILQLIGKTELNLLTCLLFRLNRKVIKAGEIIDR